MKKPSTAVRVITAIFATIFCFLFVITSFTAVLTGTVSSVTQPKTLVKFVEKIDLVEFIGDALGGSDSDEEAGIPAEVIDKVKETDFAKAVLSNYTEGIVAAVKGEEIPESLSHEEILALIDKDLDDIVEVVEEYIPEDAKGELSKEELKTFVKEGVGELAKSLPSVKEVVTMVKIEETIPAEVKFLFGPTLTIGFAVAALVLAGIIYALRFWRFGGFMWIGVSSAVTALLVGILSFGSTAVLPTLKEGLGAMSSLVDTSALIITGQLNIALIILIVVAIVFIAGCIVLRKVTAKKPVADAAPALEAEPVAEAEVVAEVEDEATDEVKELSG